MNFSLALMAGRIKGVQVDADQLVGTKPGDKPTATPDPQKILALLETSLLAGDISRQTHDAIVQEMETQSGEQAVVKPASARKNDKLGTSASSAGTIAGLILGSPEFQKK
jgi:hypothetical protein